MAGEDPIPYQALYRRFRPQRFAEVRGQEHVTRALRAAVRDGKVAHAYLFSGPRGTGKTSSARILAMALNCERPEDGEPCGQCASCQAVRSGASLDVVELDSATNRGIDEMRDLLSRVALGSPGRWKVYIVDEVHQITSAAASALLKTLEEPPGHVIFVLATTDPQKVMQTIRSRTQHFEFRLLGSDVLASLLADVAKEADIDVASDAIDIVVRRGHGSARDALSALDQVAAAGHAEDDGEVVSAIAECLIQRDAAGVLVKVAEAAASGLDARRLGTEVLEHLRNGFLATRASQLVMLGPAELADVQDQAKRLGPAALVRAMDEIGQALIDMRDAADERTTLEVAFVRLAAPELDDGRSALVERIERLERALAGGARPGAPSASPVAGPSAAPVPARPAPAAGTGPPPSPAPASGPPPRVVPAAAAAPAAGLGAPPPMPGRGPARLATPPADAPSPSAAPPPPRSVPGPAAAPSRAPAPPAPAGGSPSDPAPSPAARPEAATPTPPPAGAAAASSAASGEGAPSRQQLTLAWGDQILPSLRPAVKVYVAGGRFLASEGDSAVFALPDQGLLARAEANKAEVEAALAHHFNRPVRLELVVDDDARPTAGPPGSPSAPPASHEPPPDDIDHWSEMAEAHEAAITPQQRLMEAFPGAEEVPKQ